MRSTGVLPLLTLNDTDELALLPAASNAFAVSVCAPFASVFESSVIEYGEVVSVPLSTPSTENSTRATPTLSDAVAENVIVPDVPDSDALTVGFVVSPPPVPCVTHTGADHRILPSSCVIF